LTIQPATVATVAATLRMAAEYANPDETLLREKAAEVEADWNATHCPVCEQAECEDGCPLAEIRAMPDVASVRLAKVCDDCERCTWNPGPDCGKADHAHCPTCGHCEGRHVA
jgi:hypothetical protein